jgi:hypothetical protein
MLPTVTRLEVAAEILERIDEKRRNTGNPALGADLELRIIQRELDLLELEWLGNQTALPQPDATGGRKPSLLKRWFGLGKNSDS